MNPTIPKYAIRAGIVHPKNAHYYEFAVQVPRVHETRVRNSLEELLEKPPYEVVQNGTRATIYFRYHLREQRFTGWFQLQLAGATDYAMTYMHGSVMPSRPKLDEALNRVCPP